ncbi:MULTISPECIES: SIS domain-containing protein [unclassified Mesorhizobium]|uniref:SIS domain-containing protein n=1 Tax=unclassified Mesorhizobium TaxID=325217 RepID=UPI000BAF7A02|nr:MULTISPECIES: SIS domain-containing protein [unclassified Mesorhizobium]TGT57239.1 SIS domain-containing protein [Mesorhizobium sp. M00.F.Ca.ET.170.01.1.1]AZO12008.1 SIS domain-containing protein [Mesorhizobium sp. M3A.F.Ca.ET.080.04.2.1]PBB86095.1 sugar isomerase [Mesorhizobium sp. WSM3876]RWB66704.1 MAG: SIS domain-containing protein [Mesorhizobium sp.]RWB90655.1 MAG: SIS domain-containing protein [Mesorhizobium sp.]
MRLNPDVGQALASLHARRVSHVFLVGCGGSLSVMMAGKYFLDRHAASLASDAYNAEEFIGRDPRRLGPAAVVILCSQTGTTKETVRAARHASARGAVTIGMTLDPKSPLAEAVDHVVGYQASYTTGAPIDSACSNYGVLYMLLAGLLDQTDGSALLPPLLDSLAQLQPAIERAHRRYAGLFEDFAPRFADQQAIYTVASGAAYGAAYSFSICVLMEMQWYDSQAIHANEFFHGPFEVVDRDANFVVMLGLDETRPLAERARDFLLKYGNPDRILLMDAAELDLSGMDARFKPYLVPLVLFDALWRFAYRLADLRRHPMLEGRRYMKKLVNY